ncbi:hypothetical protein FOA52_000793 [Chlamydomonas sp. UWO 241]|nr:hypothetical protein FOA52_000793 [Chlamydomonas sp. UWO 241]
MHCRASYSVASAARRSVAAAVSSPTALLQRAGVNVALHGAPHGACMRGASVRAHASQPQVSARIAATDAPIIVTTKRLMASCPGAVSLAQGIVYWGPPPCALATAADLLREGGAGLSGYGPAEGLPALREALRAKIATQNGLVSHEVMVTAGANQAVVNAVLALVDEGDSVLLFKPYYFNHLMAVQMCGGARSVEFGDCDASTLHPDLAWLEARLSTPPTPSTPRVRMVIITNPCNPSGVLMSKEEVQQAAKLCADNGAWLLLDNTYEDFVYGGLEHFADPSPNVVHVFSMSKAYGMMGWRVGYLAYSSAPGEGGAPSLADQLLKVQDTTVICPTQLSQHVALAALGAEGAAYVKEQIEGLEGNRAAVLDALSPLASKAGGGMVAGGEGAIYFWARLPAGWEDDTRVFEWLVRRHKVCVIPGSSCGAPGHIRAAFANLTLTACVEAAGRLKAGLSELVELGPAALELQ